MKASSLIQASVLPVVEILLVCAAGALLAYNGLLGVDARKALNLVTYYLFMPALMFVALVKSVTVQALVGWWSLLLNMTLSVALGMAGGWLVSRLAGTPRHLRTHFICCAGMGNTGNLLLILVPAIARSSTLFTPADGLLGLQYVFVGVTVIFIAVFSVADALLTLPPDAAAAAADEADQPAAVVTCGKKDAADGRSSPSLSSPDDLHGASGYIEADAGLVSLAVGAPHGGGVEADGRGGAVRRLDVCDSASRHRLSLLGSDAAPPSVPVGISLGCPAAVDVGAARLGPSHQGLARTDGGDASDALPAVGVGRTAGSVDSSLPQASAPEVALLGAGDAPFGAPSHAVTGEDDRIQPCRACAATDDAPGIHTSPGLATATAVAGLVTVRVDSESMLADRRRRESAAGGKCLHSAVGNPLTCSATPLETKAAHASGSAPAACDAAKAAVWGKGGGRRAGSRRLALGCWEWVRRTALLGQRQLGSRAGQFRTRARRWTAYRGLESAALSLYNVPTMAMFASIALASVPPLQGLFFLDAEDPSGHHRAALDVVTQTMALLGAAMLPCIMLCMGGSLINGPGGGRVAPRVVVGLCVLRLVALPAVGALLVLGTKRAGLWTPPNKIYTLVMLLQHAMPTAMNLHVVAVMRRNHEDEMAALIFWQHLACIVTLPVCIAAFLQLID